MIAIDDLVEAAEIPPPDMVKMDVEGSEHLVFQGAHRTFRAHPPTFSSNTTLGTIPECACATRWSSLLGIAANWKCLGTQAMTRYPVDPIPGSGCVPRQTGSCSTAFS